jgi:hypothetical protein
VRERGGSSPSWGTNKSLIKMHKARSRSITFNIYIAGDYSKAVESTKQYCDQKGMCVTVTPTKYVYTGGEEDGVIVGIINYPRFPKYFHELFATAEEIAEKLCIDLGQQSYSIDTPKETHWYSNRPEDN